MVTLLLEKFPQHKARELIGKMNIITGLYLDTVYRLTKYTELSYCWYLCWLIWITELVCTQTSLNHEFLHWSAARNQNTVATRHVARGETGAMSPQFQSFQVNKIVEV